MESGDLDREDDWFNPANKGLASSSVPEPLNATPAPTPAASIPGLPASPDLPASPFRRPSGSIAPYAAADAADAGPSPAESIEIDVERDSVPVARQSATNLRDSIPMVHVDELVAEPEPAEAPLFLADEPELEAAADATAAFEQVDPEPIELEPEAAVLQVAPIDQGAPDAAELDAAQQGRWEQLVDVLEQRIASSTGTERIAMYKRLGQVWEDRLHRERNALDAWHSADALDGHDPDTLRALTRLYRSTQAWEELAFTIRRTVDLGELDSTLGEDEAIALYTELGTLEGDVLGRVDEAIAAWRKVIAIDPSEERALETLEGLLVRERRWEESIDVVEKRALVCDDDDRRREILLQAAVTWEEQVMDLARAAQVYERVRRADPGNRAAADRLEVIYRQQRKWTELVEVLLEQSEHVADVDNQIRILDAVAEVYEHELHDPDSAFYVLCAAFNRDYTHAPTAQALERLATATKRWEELLGEYTSRVNELEREDRVAAIGLWVEIGRWYGEHLAHFDYAIHSVQQALRLDPTHTGALAALAELQRKRGSWSELIDTLQRLAVVEGDASTKAELYVELGQLIEKHRKDVAAAIAAYQAAHDCDATNRFALTALDRMLRAAEQWEPLVDVLARRAEIEADDRQLVAIRLEIGQICDLRLYEAGRAINAYQQVLELESRNPTALRALEQLYEKTNQSEKYLDILEAQLDISSDDLERVGLYERMAAVWEERFGKTDRAIDALEKIVAIDQRNDDAYRDLARLYRQAQNWSQQVETLKRHVRATTDGATHADLCIAMAAVCEQNLDDVAGAIAAYAEALQLDPDEPRALDALGKLYDKTGDHARAIEVMSHLLEISDGAAKQVELLTRMGRILYAKLGRAEDAEAHLDRALEIDPSHVAAMVTLSKQYSDRGDWVKVAEMMLRAESASEVVIDKVRLLFEAARIYHDRLKQHDNAKELYAAVIALDPEHVEAGHRLAAMYFDAEDWAALSPVIEMLVRKAVQLEIDRPSAPPHGGGAARPGGAGAFNPRELNELTFRAARCASELGDDARALHHYERAHELDPQDLSTLIGRADLLFKLQDWDHAAEQYRTILVSHAGRQPAADVHANSRLGMVFQVRGDRRQALELFDKALALDPSHRDTLQAVVDLQQQQGEWDAVIAAKRGLMTTAPVEERLALLDQIAGVYRDKLSAPQKAIAAYGEAIELAPNDHGVLQKLLDLYTETKQWKRAVETMQRFVALETDPFRKGVYLHAAATVCRHEVKSLDEALHYYNQSLECFFSQPDKLDDTQLGRALKSFEAIDQVLTTKRDWKAQERAYLELLDRLPKDGNRLFHKLHVMLFDGLGEIYRSRLKQYESASGVFEIAQQMDPKSELRAGGADRAEVLAELYMVAGPDHADKAITQHLRMLGREPFKYDSYKALARIYKDTHQHDKRWCVSSTLAFLKKADADERAFYEQYKRRGMVKAKHAMSRDTWNRLAPADENRGISAILAACSAGVSELKAFPHKDLGIKREERRQVLADDLAFSKQFCYVGRILDVQLPEVYLVDDGKAIDIQLANAIDKSELCPSFVVRPHRLQGKTERELAFLLTRTLAHTRPEYYLRMLLPTNTELKVVVLAALAMTQPGFEIPPHMAETVQKYLPDMQKRIKSRGFDQLHLAVQAYLKTGPTGEPDLVKWSNAVDAATHRAGFVVCGDLEIAARMVAVEPVVVGATPIKDKLKELVLFSISEDYFAIRAQTGLTIG